MRGALSLPSAGKHFDREEAVSDEGRTARLAGSGRVFTIVASTDAANGADGAFGTDTTNRSVGVMTPTLTSARPPEAKP